MTVVGTGASAIQFVPEIAKISGHVDFYQRSAPYVLGVPPGGVAPEGGVGTACDGPGPFGINVLVPVPLTVTS